MRSKFKWIFTLLLALSMQFSFAQEKTVTGVVSDKTGPLPGANVVVKGTKNSTQTDFDGKFTIKAKAGDVLEASFTGYSKKSVTVGAANSYNVVLSEGVELQEVVVVGYGTTTKEAYTGTATKIKVENIEAKTVSNVSQALRGEVAGVNVITGSGAPGADATIRIRGFGSINGNRSPLYVVDGAPYSSDISAINPEDIANITVLKDAAATSIYGSRGANGVILITTKQGKAGKSVVSVDVRTSVNSFRLPNYEVLTSPEEYIGLAWSELRQNAFLSGNPNPNAYASTNLFDSSNAIGLDPAYNMWDVPGDQVIDPATGQVASGVSRRYTPTSWKDTAFGTGLRSEANVQFSGGNDKTKYATSFGYLDDKGAAINSSYKRYTTRLNLESNVNDWFKIGGSISYSGGRYLQTDGADQATSVNLFSYTVGAPPIYDPYLRDASGNLVADPYFGGYQFDFGNGDNGNPVRRFLNNSNGIAEATLNKEQTDATTFLGNFNTDIKITDALHFETRYSGQYEMNEGLSVSNPFYGQNAGSDGALFLDNIKSTNQNFLQLLRFNKTFANKHRVEAFVAHESTEFRQDRLATGATGAVIPMAETLYQYTTLFGTPTHYKLGWTLESYFAQLNYNYQQKYFLTASARRDGSSRFINDKWGTFGSVGLGWVVSKESFLEKASFIDYLKLKASYGVIGDQGTAFQYGFRIYNITPLTGGILYAPNATRPNPNLTWETSKIAQVGFESSWFDRLNLDVDYYVKNTTNLFFDNALPPSSGYTNIQFNSGKLQNSGLEFDINYQVLKGDKPEAFKLAVGVNGEMLKSKMVDMPNDYITGEEKIFQFDPNTGLAALVKGHSLYEFYMREWVGVDPATGLGLYNLYYNDVNDDGVFNNGDVAISNYTDYLAKNPDANVEKTLTNNSSIATQKFTGKSAIPKVRGAFRINASYRNFDLTTQFGYSFGGYAYDNGYAQLMQTGDQIGSNNYHVDIRNRWQQPGDITNVPRMSAGLTTEDTYSSAQSTRFLIKSDYIAFNNARLGYTLAKSYTDRLGLSKLNVYISGDNLALFSARKGFNPQTFTSTSGIGGYIPMTTFSFGARVEF
ncbi:SusC/RagA family TonB-linked outer membrane protein [Flavobacterium sp. AS60]|uniref:SusC/RagA family TonB-linked outer membrane protein n=1 Tax=Flavobacterium anseongense TaxID=2910677 RepID=UPI001F1FE81E|nr:SusC/RagA family TonB-linked outer membrane protein [Flavobacterium sp. AS60]MCF6128228.1 SusC/RagA family TonB-linked outer membrane protein [Flavobacterium sp. AS60]